MGVVSGVDNVQSEVLFDLKTAVKKSKACKYLEEKNFCQKE